MIYDVAPLPVHIMTDLTPTKCCRKCQDVKLLTEFGVDRKTNDGPKTRCRECIAEENRQYKIGNRPVIRAERQRYRKRYAKKIADYMRRYRSKILDAELSARIKKSNEAIALKTGQLTANQSIISPETLKIEELLFKYKTDPSSVKGKCAYRDAKALAIKIRMKYDVFSAMTANRHSL